MSSVENDRRWWSVPGEVVATLTAAGHSIPVLFEYDDGTLWGLRVGSEAAVWDHHATALALSPKGLGAEALRHLREVLREMGGPRPGWQLAPREQALIDQMEPGLGDSHWLSGRRLRHATNLTSEEFAAASEPLVPRYVEKTYGDKGDYYRLTLPGLLRWKEKARAENVIDAALRTLRNAFDRDPDFAGFSSDDVVAEAGLDAAAGRFVDAVVSTAWLLHGASGGGHGSAWRMTYGVPQDVEDLVRCNSVRDFLRLVSKGEHRFRPWPTAPIRLASPMGTPQVEALPSRTEATKYDVTLSFAGEDRAHAEGLAERLRAAGVTVFYDRYEQAILWGKDLYEHLHSVYSEQATYCVIFVSEHYAKKLWTSHERKAAQERAFKENGGEYILPIRLDATRLPGLAETVGYVGIDEGIDRIAELLLEKLGSHLRTQHAAVQALATPTLADGDRVNTRDTDPSSAEPANGGSGWLPPTASMAGSNAARVHPLSWRLRLTPTLKLRPTKAELHEALTGAVVTYDLANFGRSARWPRPLVLPEVRPRTLPEGSQLWSFTYAEAQNMVGDEQVVLSPGGEVTFQRDTLWDTAEPAADFGLLADDVLAFLVLANGFSSRLHAADEMRIELSLRVPPSIRGTLAIFHATTVNQDQPHRAARLPPARTPMTGAVDVSAASTALGEGIAAAAKRLIDHVANDFELDTSVLGPGGPNFMALAAPSLARRFVDLRIVPPRFPRQETRPDGPDLSLRFETESMDRDKSGTVVVHHYELVTRVVNTTSSRLSDWYLEVELPTPLLEPHTIYATLVRERSTSELSVFRTSTKLPPIPVGDPYEWRVPYRVDDNLFRNRRDVVEHSFAIARLFVNGALVVATKLAKIQNF